VTARARRFLTTEPAVDFVCESNVLRFVNSTSYTLKPTANAG
jgi:hypothetical protein